MLHNILVNTRCTDSSLLIAVIVQRDQTGEQATVGHRPTLQKLLLKYQHLCEQKTVVFDLQTTIDLIKI